MISLKFMEIELNIKNVLIENIGILGLYLLKAFKDGLSLEDISDITKFEQELIKTEMDLLSQRGYLEETKITDKGVKLIKIYDFIEKINNSTIVVDLYLKEFFFVKKEFLSEKPLFQIYPQKLFDYGILKKINEYKEEIISKFNTEKLKIYYDNFELSYKFKKFYFVNFDKVVFGGDFPIGEKVLKISYNIQNLKNENLNYLFKNFYFSLFSKKRYKNIKEYKGKIFLPENYTVNDVECYGKVDLNKICLLNMSVNVEKRNNKKFINIEEMIRNISESN